MDIINWALIAINVIVLAALAMEGPIQTVSPVYLLFYSTKNALLLVQTDIIHQVKFAITAIVLAALVQEVEI